MTYSKRISCKLEDVCLKITDGSHYSPKECDEGYPMFSVKDMTEYGFDYSSCKRISSDDFERMVKNDCVPKVNDVLIAKDGSYLKHIFVTREEKKEAILSSIAIFRPNTEIIAPRFLSYLLKNPVMKQNIKDNYVSGSALPRIVLKDFKKITIDIPQMPEQKAITDTLSCLDDKIELNNCISKNLEEIAQAIFKHWFVDFEFPDENDNPYKSGGGKMVESELGKIPKGWQVVKVGDINVKISDYVANGSFASLKQNVTLYEEINFAYFIRNTDLKANVFKKFVDEHAYNFLSKTKLFGNEVIISNVGDVGSVFLCPVLDKPMTLGNNIIMITSENKVYYNYFMYMLFKYSYGKDLIKSITGGSAQPKFNKTDFRSLKIILPTDDVIVQFNDLVEKLFELKNKNSSEITTLTIIRDTLLPKLLSGEIELPIEEEV